MTFRPEAKGSIRGPFDWRWSSSDSLLYSLGVGAGPEELAFTTENSAGHPQQVLPTFAVMNGRLRGDLLDEIGTIDWENVVHGAQSFELSGEIPVEGALETY